MCLRFNDGCDSRVSSLLSGLLCSRLWLILRGWTTTELTAAGCSFSRQWTSISVRELVLEVSYEVFIRRPYAFF